MNATTARAPLWGKSMQRYLNGSRSTPTTTAPGEPGIDEKILNRLGLNPPPADAKLLAEFLVADDAHDGEIDLDEFNRGIRRAVRLRFALAANLHRQAGQPWKEWVSARFKVGYACFNRYHVAAELQIGLLTRGLPALKSEAQSRVLAPFRKHTKFWDALATFRAELPAPEKLKTTLPKLLGLEVTAAAVTQRIKLHRALGKLVKSIRGAPDDPSVSEAIALMSRAIAILEGRGT